MSQKLALLRGINVGGKRKVLMADLKDLVRSLGGKEVQTYIQSGNLIFSSDQSNSDIESSLEKAIRQQYGFEVPVVVRETTDIPLWIAQNPFFKEDRDIPHLHLTFLKKAPLEEDIAVVNSYDYTPDRFHLGDQEVYVYCEGKYHQSKLTNNFFEKKLKVGATTRNWKTILKLQELSQK